MILLVALCILVPLVEIAVVIQVGHWIGVPETIALLLAVSVVGAWLVKVQGVAVLRRIGLDLSARQVPARSMVDGALVLVAGVLLLIPGFVTDIVGLFLLVPPVRKPVRDALLRRWTRRYLVRRVA